MSLSVGFESELRELKNLGLEIRENEDLSKYSYYKIGGRARAIVFPKNSKELEKLFSVIGSRFYILGAGSNLIIDDSPIQDWIICTRKLNHQKIIVDEEKKNVQVGAGVMVSMFLRRATSEGWDGFEFLTGIPGTMGGVVAMNAGTHLGEISGVVQSARGFDFSLGQVFEKSLSKNDFSYRKNFFLGKSSVISSITLHIPKISTSSLVGEKISLLLKRRKETQPVEYPSCGSVFKNPTQVDLRAWQVVDLLGFRGATLGGAQVSEKHPNFIINKNNAKASEVRELIEKIQSEAEKKLGIHLDREVQYFPPITPNQKE
jgi:UDP-N-acetylmuramate dehydrogenase